MNTIRDPKRRANLERAIGEMQDTFDHHTIYCAGLVELIGERNFPGVTAREIRAILEEHGMRVIGPERKDY